MTCFHPQKSTARDLTVKDSQAVKLKEELESTSQMYTSTLDDLSAQEAEVKRLRAKLRGLELEVKETKEANAKNEEKVSWRWG